MDFYKVSYKKGDIRSSKCVQNDNCSVRLTTINTERNVAIRKGGGAESHSHAPNPEKVGALRMSSIKKAASEHPDHPPSAVMRIVQDVWGRPITPTKFGEYQEIHHLSWKTSEKSAKKSISTKRGRNFRFGFQISRIRWWKRWIDLLEKNWLLCNILISRINYFRTSLDIFVFGHFVLDYFFWHYVWQSFWTYQTSCPILTKTGLVFTCPDLFCPY